MSEPSFMPAVPDDITPVELNKLEKLDTTGQQIINIIEQFYVTTNKIPTANNIANLLSLELSVAKSYLEHPTVLQALRGKGILTSSVDANLLTSRQLLAANMVTTRADKRSMREKLKEVGVSVTEWQGWLKQKAFADYLNKRSGVDFHNSDYLTNKTLLDAVEDGDLSATKLVLEMQGRYNPRLDVNANINIGLIFTHIVDIISPYLTEETLIEIAEKLDTLYTTHTGKQLSIAS